MMHAYNAHTNDRHNIQCYMYTHNKKYIIINSTTTQTKGNFARSVWYMILKAKDDL